MDLKYNIIGSQESHGQSSSLKFLYGMESSANMLSLFKNFSLSFEVRHTSSKYLTEIQMW